MMTTPTENRARTLRDVQDGLITRKGYRFFRYYRDGRIDPYLRAPLLALEAAGKITWPVIELDALNEPPTVTARAVA